MKGGMSLSPIPNTRSWSTLAHMIFVSCGLRFDLLDLCVFFLPKSTIKKNFPKTRFFTYLEDPGIYIYIIVYLYVIMIIMMIIILNIYIIYKLHVYIALWLPHFPPFTSMHQSESPCDSHRRLVDILQEAGCYGLDLWQTTCLSNHGNLPSLKLTVRPWKSQCFLVNSIKMVDFPWLC